MLQVDKNSKLLDENILNQSDELIIALIAFDQQTSGEVMTRVERTSLARVVELVSDYRVGFDRRVGDGEPFRGHFHEQLERLMRFDDLGTNDQV